jgi:hypothetical protein
MPSAGERHFLLPFCCRQDKKEGVWRDATRRLFIRSEWCRMFTSGTHKGCPYQSRGLTRNLAIGLAGKTSG